LVDPFLFKIKRVLLTSFCDDHVLFIWCCTIVEDTPLFRWCWLSKFHQCPWSSLDNTYKYERLYTRRILGSGTTGSCSRYL